MAGALADAKTELIRNAAIAGAAAGIGKRERINAAAVASGTRHSDP